MCKSVVLTLILMLGSGVTAPPDQKYQPNWESLDQRPIPRWFSDAKFGIFIHWGIYSVPSWRKVSQGRYASYAEWYYARVMYDNEGGGRDFHIRNYGKDFEYRDFAPFFRAELFEPEQWAELFSRSGARYVVLTSKHHDGYCLWPTSSPYKRNWNSAAVGPERDLVCDLAASVRSKGMRFGLYYSIIEWESSRTHRTDSGYYVPLEIVKKYAIPENEYIDRHLIPQLKDLVMRYQPAVIFGDAGEWDLSAAEWKTLDFLAWMYNHAPNKNEVVVNDRFGKDMPGRHGDYYSSEYQDAEDTIGIQHPWEESRGIGGSYGFNRDENIDDYRISDELVHELISIVSRGGNLLLNVGPTADGRIPVIMQQRLIDIGEWLKVNGEAIYASRPYQGLRKPDIPPGLFLTRKDKDLFLLCTSWPERDLFLENLNPDGLSQVRLLGYEGSVFWEKHRNGIIIRSPNLSPGSSKCRFAWVFKLSGILSD